MGRSLLWAFLQKDRLRISELTDETSGARAKFSPAF
jgi:hypothetical protein